jgi:hypothetical protein
MESTVLPVTSRASPGLANPSRAVYRRLIEQSQAEGKGEGAPHRDTGIQNLTKESQSITKILETEVPGRDEEGGITHVFAALLHC